MGFALAREAERRGARVTLITGPTEIPPPHCHRLIRVVTAREMHRAVLRFWKESDVVISAAAVCDWRPARTAAKKIKKTRSSFAFRLPLVLNPDILKDLSRLKARHGQPLPVLVGFALETNDLLKNARAKLSDKRLVMIVANSIDSLKSSRARVTLLDSSGRVVHWPAMEKTAVAKRILDVLQAKFLS